MINIDYTLLVQAAVFILFVFLINRLVFRPVQEALARRREATIGAQEKALRLQEKARKEQALLEEKLAQARLEAAREKARLREKIVAEQRAFLEKAKATIDSEIPGLRSQAMREMEKAEEDLKRDVESFARRMAGKVLGRAV